MLLQRIKGQTVALSLLTDYLKKNNNDITTFFTKIPILYQFAMINRWLTFNHNIGIVITPDSYIIYHFEPHPFDKCLLEYLIEVNFENINDDIYELAIRDAFIYLQNKLNIKKDDKIPF